MAELLVGKNPLEIEFLLHKIDAFLVGNPTTKSAIDMALFDLAAKWANLPLYAYLGGKKRDFYTNFTIGLNPPEVMAQEASQYKKDGAKAIKVKLGTGHGQDVERIQAIQSEIGNEVLLRIDANQGWDVPTAIATLKDLAPYNIQFCEEPVAHWNNQGLKYVRDNSSIPIMADESVFSHHDAYKLAGAGACDYINIKFAKCGGILNGLKINAVAEAAGIGCMVGQMAASRLGVSAQAHFYCARKNILFADLDSFRHQHPSPVTSGVSFEGPCVIIPDTPGHGADLDPDYLRELPQVQICI
jgi:L-alanine-DL-glutamate epimerase-like enolase superfamily enzyme